MPELPEVETYRTELEPRLVGRTFRRVEIFDPRLTRPADPVEVAAELEGERVASVDRRGKYLVVRFESGLALLVHLRMTGGFPVEEASHVRASVELSGAGRLAIATSAASARGSCSRRTSSTHISPSGSAGSRSSAGSTRDISGGRSARGGLP